LANVLNGMLRSEPEGIRIFTADKAQLAANISRAGHCELGLDLAKPMQRSSRVREHVLRRVGRGREFARRVCMLAARCGTERSDAALFVACSDSTGLPEV
jgi:hypothetical protein